MQCVECDSVDATMVAVEYTEGHREEIALCTDCRDEFEDGGFVQTTSAVKP